MKKVSAGQKLFAIPGVGRLQRRKCALEATWFVRLMFAFDCISNDAIVAEYLLLPAGTYCYGYLPTVPACAARTIH